MYCEPKAKLKWDPRAVVLSALWIIGIKKAEMFVLPRCAVKGCSCKLCSAAGHEQHIKPRCDCGTKAVLAGEEGRGWGPRIHQVHGFCWWNIWKDIVCVCVTGTAGLSAPQESENAPLAETVSQKLLQASEQSSEMNGGTFPVDTIVSLNVYLLRWF